MNDHFRSDQPDDKDELELELAAMLGRRADDGTSWPENVPDLDRVMADAERRGPSRSLDSPSGTASDRRVYLLSVAALLLVLVGAGLFTTQTVSRVAEPGGEAEVPGLIVDADSTQPLQTTTTVPELVSTASCIAGTEGGCGGATTLATYPDAEAEPYDPEGIYTECFEDQTSTTLCCTPGTTTICNYYPVITPAPPLDPSVPADLTASDCQQTTTIPACSGITSSQSEPTSSSQPVPTVPVDPADCRQVTTVPGCAELSTTIGN